MDLSGDEIHKVSMVHWVTVIMQTESGELFGPLSVKHHKMVEI